MDVGSEHKNEATDELKNAGKIGAPNEPVAAPEGIGFLVAVERITLLTHEAKDLATVVSTHERFD
jgi:hypothetical protein